MSHGVLYVVPGSDTQQLTDAQDRPSNNAADMLFEMIARHGLRAARISFDISRRLGASESAACLIARAAIHHDLGKLLVPAELLFFPGPLSELEKRLLRMHTVAGSALAARVLSRTLQPESACSTIAAVCRHHHEHWDGKGYPEGISGTQIPIAARIVAVADVFDALTSERAYRQSSPPEDAFREIVNQSGAQFDPDVVAAFIAVAAPYLADPCEAEPLPSSLDLWIYKVAKASVASRRRS